MMLSKAQKLKQRGCPRVQQQILSPELVFLLQLEVLSGEEGTASASTTGTGAPKQSFQSKAKCGAQQGSLSQLVVYSKIPATLL